MVGLAEVVATDGIEPSLTGPKAVVLTVIRQGGKAGAGCAKLYRTTTAIWWSLRPGCADFSAIFINFVVSNIKINEI